MKMILQWMILLLTTLHIRLQVCQKINNYHFIFILSNANSKFLGMMYISHDISIPQIPPLTNKSIVTIHAFVSLKSIYVCVDVDKSQLNKFMRDFSEICLICTYFFYLT